MACLVRSRPVFPGIKLLASLATLLLLQPTTSQFVNSQGDNGYIDPNQYITKQNKLVQDRFHSETQSRGLGQDRFNSDKLVQDRFHSETRSRSTARPDLQGAAQTFDVGGDYDDLARARDLDYQDISGRSGLNPSRNGVNRNSFARAFNPSSAVFNSNQLGPRVSQQELEIERVLAQIDEASTAQCAANVHAQWEFETNVNEVTQLKAVSVKVLCLILGGGFGTQWITVFFITLELSLSLFM